LSSSPERDIERFLEIFEASDLTTLRIVTPDLELHLSRRADGDLTTSPAAAAPASVAAPSAAPAVPAPEPPASATPAGDGHVVRAPMVGTVYRSPEPGAPPFVHVGDAVDADSTVCIVEAMKVFTAVAAGEDGVVEAIHVDTGDFVEFDQPLLRIAPRPENGV
jgi:acetyl-CoA carboxylase biotin carboxyl carrier protein